jgi:hypothetical protein
MTANGTVLVAWAGGEDQFCLAKVGLILDLEAKCDAGIAVVFTRLGSGTWRLQDVRETIRLGLIGGGMDPAKAIEAVRRHVDEGPLTSSVLLAYSIIEAVMVGVKNDPVGKQPGEDPGQGKDQPAGARNTGYSTTTDASDGPN